MSAQTCASRQGVPGSQRAKRTDLGEIVKRSAPRTPGCASAGAVPLRLEFGDGVSSRPLGRREETAPAESARRGGLQAAGAKGHRGQGGEHRRRSQGDKDEREEPRGARTHGGAPDAGSGGRPGGRAVRLATVAAAQAGIARPCILAAGGRAPWTLRDRGASAAHRSCCRGPSKSNASWRARAAGRRRTAGRARWWAPAPGARRWPGWRG